MEPGDRDEVGSRGRSSSAVILIAVAAFVIHVLHGMLALAFGVEVNTRDGTIHLLDPEAMIASLVQVTGVALGAYLLASPISFFLEGSGFTWARAFLAACLALCAELIYFEPVEIPMGGSGHIQFVVEVMGGPSLALLLARLLLGTAQRRIDR